MGAKIANSFVLFSLLVPCAGEVSPHSVGLGATKDDSTNKAIGDLLEFEVRDDIWEGALLTSSVDQALHVFDGTFVVLSVVVLHGHVHDDWAVLRISISLEVEETVDPWTKGVLVVAWWCLVEEHIGEDCTKVDVWLASIGPVFSAPLDPLNVRSGGVIERISSHDCVNEILSGNLILEEISLVESLSSVLPTDSVDESTLLVNVSLSLNILVPLFHNIANLFSIALIESPVVFDTDTSWLVGSTSTI